MLDPKNMLENENTTPVAEESRENAESSLYDSIRNPDHNQVIHKGVQLKSTGIFVLDRTLGGGLPAGSLTFFSADPRSMSEVFLYQFTQSRKTYYFTTNRRPRFVLNDVINLGFDPSNIIFVDIYSEYYCTSCGEISDNLNNEFIDSKILEFTEYNLRNIANDSSGEDVNIIFDSFCFFTGLTANKGLIKQLINVIYETTKELNCLTYLYGSTCTTNENLKAFIYSLCDVIFESMLDEGADKVVSKLAIPKIRGMIPNTEIIKFKIGDGVQIDTSRDIA
ncbi:RecA-superfamily ATPase, KaiC/GvpD/RAD55 family [Methanolobus vulcani]|uniref:RecA-superfamily ATPase, KaiC/GvpD/RAD55 family n=1 Tax=Methanolobus vulcani TaxID=38026 RepID=A0A7Z7AXJ3_9EURY|nr:RAD55 family ATPase [Methanolobus vulcani]SDG03835.1 RecA-superfamily ATPase, KaiC/GvpD/RAD55 family [Methanolobus vulcani]